MEFTMNKSRHGRDLHIHLQAIIFKANLSSKVHMKTKLKQ